MSVIKNKINITIEGRKQLEAELQQLKDQRSELSDRVAEAREHGDLSENAEYDAARTEQGVAETRIAEIENILKNAKIIKASCTNSKIVLGSQITLLSGKTEVKYKLVGPVEADPLSGKISDASPIGEALIGKTVGDVVEIVGPKTKIVYKIIDIA